MKTVRKNMHTLLNVCINKVGISKKSILVYLITEILKKFWDLLPTLCYFILLHVVIEQKNDKYLILILSLYLIVFIGQTIIGKFEVNIRNSINAKLLSSLREKAMDKLLNMELANINNESDLKYLVHDDSEQITDYFSQSIGFLCNIISFLITTIIIIVLQWKLALICFCIIPISFWLTTKINKKSYNGYEKQRTLDVEYNQLSEEVFHNWVDIRANGIENYEKQSFISIWKKIGDNNFKVHLFWFFNRTLITFKDVFVTKILIYLLGGLLIVYSQFNVASLIVFVDYYMRLMNDLFSIVDNVVMMQRKQVSLNKWIQFVNAEEIQCKIVKCNSVNFKEISFSYNERKLIDNFNLQANPGDVIGIFGKSGMGKTTIIQLLLKVLIPHNGNILLGEINIKEVNCEGLFSNIGFMMQDASLFDMTIYDNLLLGNNSVTREKAINILSALKFDIDRFPDGLNTRVGQNGQYLSGGERQKIIIARTLLRNVQILVLDEPVSALDETSRNALYKYIVENEIDRTIIMISHDMEAKNVCNKQVYFMGDGIIETTIRESI